MAAASRTSREDSESRRFEDAKIAAENSELRSRLKVLQERLDEERQYSYVRANGYLSGAETIFMETMEVAEAMQWCNARPDCKGFTYLAPLDREGDGDEEEEVTITFKGEAEPGSAFRVDADVAQVSYIKASAAEGILGAVGDAAMQLSGADGQAVVSQWLGSMGSAWLFLFVLVGVVVRRFFFGRGRASLPLPTQSS